MTDYNRRGVRGVFTELDRAGETFETLGRKGALTPSQVIHAIPGLTDRDSEAVTDVMSRLYPERAQMIETISKSAVFDSPQAAAKLLMSVAYEVTSLLGEVDSDTFVSSMNFWQLTKVK